MSKEEALRLERAAIDLLGFKKLTNAQRGHGADAYGRATADEIRSVLAGERAEIEEAALLIRINRLYDPTMSGQALYDATRGIWVVGERRERADYALAVYESIVKEVYHVAGWYPSGTTFNVRAIGNDWLERGRWEFVGRVAEEAVRGKYLHKSVAHYYANGAQNPITYVNVPE